jgi:hypothetical protein
VRGKELRIASIILGIIIAAAGGVISYRSFFVEPHAAVVVTNTSVRELPNMVRVASGIILLVAGAALAFFAALRRR